MKQNNEKTYVLRREKMDSTTYVLLATLSAKRRRKACLIA